jgi:hypothetical protein
MRWCRLLGLSRQIPPSWYRHRLYEELLERRAAKIFWHRISETLDAFFSITPSRYDGFPVRQLPHFVVSRYSLPYAYMLAKYTSRWAFHRTAAMFCGAPAYGSVREVVNPSKDHKLDEVVSGHQIDVAKFRRVGGRLRRV